MCLKRIPSIHFMDHLFISSLRLPWMLFSITNLEEPFHSSGYKLSGGRMRTCLWKSQKLSHQDHFFLNVFKHNNQRLMIISVYTNMHIYKRIFGWHNNVEQLLVHCDQKSPLFQISYLGATWGRRNKICNTSFWSSASYKVRRKNFIFKRSSTSGCRDEDSTTSRGNQGCPRT